MIVIYLPLKFVWVISARRAAANGAKNPTKNPKITLQAVRKIMFGENTEA